MEAMFAAFLKSVMEARGETWAQVIPVHGDNDHIGGTRRGGYS